jgi:hypothetical protein
VGYPLGLVQVVAARLQEARTWESDEVRCESWFAGQKNGGNTLITSPTSGQFHILQFD